MLDVVDSLEFSDVLLDSFSVERGLVFSPMIDKQAYFSNTVYYQIETLEESIFCIITHEALIQSTEFSEHFQPEERTKITCQYVVTFNCSEVSKGDDIQKEPVAKMAAEYSYPYFKDKVIISTAELGFEPLVLPPYSQSGGRITYQNIEEIDDFD